MSAMASTPRCFYCRHPADPVYDWWISHSTVTHNWCAWAADEAFWAAWDAAGKSWLKVVQAGDLEITVQATTDVPVREEYINATVTHAAQVTIGPDGTLLHHVAGIPFPLIDPGDPQAGLKMGWNLRYRDRADISQSWGTTSLLNSSGGVERSSSSLYMRMDGMHRPNPERNIAEWAEDGVLYKDYSITLPFGSSICAPQWKS